MESINLQKINKRYIIDLNKNYLLLEVKDIKDSYKTHMLAENQIQGLLNMSYIRKNNEQQFMYDISSLQPMDKLYGSVRLCYEDIKYIIQGICKVCENISRYMLRAENIMFSPDMIYMCAETGETRFVLNPYYCEPVWQQLQELSRYFIGKINYTDVEAVTCVYKFNEIVMRDTFMLNDILQALDIRVEYSKEEYEEQIEYTDERVVNRRTGFIDKLTSIIKNKFQSYIKEPDLVCEEKSIYEINENSEEIGHTVLMHISTENSYYFCACSNNYEDIKISDKSIVIGKLEKNVDVVINDPSVSRIHAKCEVSGDKCYIEDLNTTNGTYINGRRLIPYKLEELNVGDKVIFGCIEYIIRNR
ncbi:MAG: FHA domain-containing protein [Lachnospiraceae bacterium]|nr:FHA domain-containing protein [Lachnospiraceae bacterium]MBQ4069425.1 FHA domain-containing protein [Lachnospiraceae bacterium]